MKRSRLRIIAEIAMFFGLMTFANAWFIPTYILFTTAIVCAAYSFYLMKK